MISDVTEARDHAQVEQRGAEAPTGEREIDRLDPPRVRSLAVS